MTNSDPAAKPTNLRQLKIAFPAVLFSLLIGAFAVSDQSLWIDEAHSAARAMQPSLGTWWTKMMLDKGSDLQMPFYMLYLWVWAKVFGASEIALRASNIPWLTAAVLALVWGFPQQRRLQLSIVLLALSSPFLWYYTDEARPYVVLFAFSALTAACLFRLSSGPQFSLESSAWFRLFCVGLAGLCATSLIAVPWAVAAAGAFVYWSGPCKTLRTAVRFPLSFGLLIMAVAGLGIYYLWTLQLGARASDVGRTGLANVGFIFYELLGLSGIGPGRLAIREDGVRALAGFLPILAIGVLAVAAVSLASLAEIWRSTTRREVIFFSIALVCPFCAILAAGGAAHMRLLGRHSTPALPFILGFLAVGLQTLFSSPARWMRITAVATILLLLTSALEIRFSQRHQRDDYRTAATEARQAIESGKKVWWAADIDTATFYGLPLNSPNLIMSSGLTERSFESLLPPDLVCLSKPDVYDPTGKIRNYIREYDFSVKRVLPAFQILERQPDHQQAR